MSALLKHRLARRFGLWYLAYEALSLVAFVSFGAQFLTVH